MQDSKRHRYKDKTWTLGEGEGGIIWENSIETYITIWETDHQSRFDAWNRTLKACALGQPWGMGWGGSMEGVQDGGHMHTHFHSRQCVAKTSTIL